jgi:uncharacterized membrane protein YfcA
LGPENTGNLASSDAGSAGSLGRDSIPVLIEIAVGTVLGFLSGLGVGGGSLLILWLTVVLGFDPQAARGINLLFFIPSALIAICFRWKQGAIPFRKILPGILSGCAAAFLFSMIGQNLGTTLLKKIFGGLLIVTGLRELCYKPKKQREEH